MKRTVAVLAALLLCLSVFLTACTGKTEKPEDVYKNATGFEAALSVKTGESEFDFNVSRLKPDYFELNFTSPEILKHFTVIFNGDDVKLKYYGFELSLNRFPLPIEGGISKIVDVLSVIDDGYEKLELKENEDGSLLYQGEGFSVKVSPDDLLPISFEITLENGGSYFITVKEFKLITNEGANSSDES